MREQLERDIEVLRKIERLLNEELSQDSFYEYDFMEELEEFKLAKSDLEFRLKSLEAKEQDELQTLKRLLKKHGIPGNKIQD